MISLNKLRIEDLIYRIVKLDTFVRRDVPQKADNEGYISFETYAPRRDSATLLVNAITLKCELITWLESGHNGSSYDDTREVLADEAAVEHLKRIEDLLFRQAENRVVDDQRREEERLRAMALRAQTNAIVFGDRE